MDFLSSETSAHADAVQKRQEVHLLEID